MMTNNPSGVMERYESNKPPHSFLRIGYRFRGWFDSGMRIAGTVLMLTLIACSQPASNTKELRTALDSVNTPSHSATVLAESASETSNPAVNDNNVAAADSTNIDYGSEKFLGPNPNSKPRKSAVDGEETVVLNFQAADIHEVVKAILGEMLGENYLIEQGVTGTVTTETSGGLAKSDLLPILEALLRQAGASLLKEDGVYRVVPLTAALKSGVSAQTERLRPDGSYALQIVALRYIAAREMEKILEPVLSDRALAYVDEKRNLLMLAGTAQELRRYIETITVFDVDWMKGMSVGLFPLKFVAPNILVDELNAALGDGSGKILEGLVRLVALDRINSLLAISPTRRSVNEIESWVRKLDVPGDSTEPQLYVFRLQNAKAEDVAAILNDVFSDSQFTAERHRERDLAPGLEPITLDSPRRRDEADSSEVSTTDPGGGVAFRVGENVRIIPDDTNNSLVILATPKEYSILSSAVEKLDLVPLQVLIEATIIEVTLSDSLEFGVEWFFKNGLGNDKQGQGLLDIGAPGIGTLAPAFSYAVIDSAGQVRAALNALATDSEVSILSSPSLMVLDNQTAIINVGDEIPIPTRSATSNIDATAPTVNEIEYRNTGVTLEVTPRVNAGGLVTMEVDQEVSDAVSTTSSDLNAPTIQQRRITSTVAVQSGETIVLGGLIRDSATESESGLPYLRNLPIVGKAFGQTSDSARRTELIVLITPRAVGSDVDAREVTREYADKLKNFEPPAAVEIRP